MLRKFLAWFGYRIEYVSEFDAHAYRYDGIDRAMGRPIHKHMGVAPPWARMRIVKDASKAAEGERNHGRAEPGRAERP